MQRRRATPRPRDARASRVKPAQSRRPTSLAQVGQEVPQILGELAVARKATLLDEASSRECEGKLIRIGRCDQCDQIDLILRPPSRISRQELERDQVTGASDPTENSGPYLEFGRLGDDLGLDARRREEQVHHHGIRVTAGCHESCGRKTAGRILLDHCHDSVARRDELANQRLGLDISGDRDREVDVPREASLRARRDGESSDDRRRMPHRVEITDGLVKAAMKLVHGAV